MRPVLLVLASCVGSGCIGTGEPAPASEPMPASEPVLEDVPMRPAAEPVGDGPLASAHDPVPTSGVAVVRVGATLHTGDAPLHVPELAGALGVTVAVRGEQEGLVAIETLGPAAEGTCAGRLTGLDALRLRLQVARRDLVQVVAEPILHHFADGTSLLLGPGVPLEAWLPGGSRAVAGTTAVVLPIAGSDIGTFFTSAPPFDGEGAELMLAYGGTVSLGPDQELDTHGLYGGPRSPRIFERRDVDDERARITVRSACLQAQVFVPRSRVQRVDASPGLSPYAGRGSLPMTVVQSEVNARFLGSPTAPPGPARPTPAWAIEEGAAVYWETGALAGWVEARHHLDGKGTSIDGRRCWDHPLVEGEPPTLTLCFDPKTVVPRERAEAPLHAGR